MSNIKVLYDITLQAQDSPDLLIQLSIILVAIGLVSIGVRIYYANILILRKLAFYVGGISVGCLLPIYVANSIRENHNELISMASSGKCSVVQGKVENFHPMPASGHDTERFGVSGVFFSYSDFEITGAFNNTASHGGPIKEGINLRISYIPAGRNNLIVKIEAINS